MQPVVSYPRVIQYDVFCNNCKSCWTCNCVIDYNPNEVQHNIQEFTSTDQCIHCNKVGEVIVLSVEDSLQSLLTTQYLIQAVLQQFTTAHLLKNRGFTEIDFPILSPHHIMAEVMIIENNTTSITCQITADFDRITIIFIHGDSRAIADTEKMMSGKSFFGLPIDRLIRDEIEDGYVHLSLQIGAYK